MQDIKLRKKLQSFLKSFLKIAKVNVGLIEAFTA